MSTPTQLAAVATDDWRRARADTVGRWLVVESGSAECHHLTRSSMSSTCFNESMPNQGLPRAGEASGHLSQVSGDRDDSDCLSFGDGLQLGMSPQLREQAPDVGLDSQS